MKNITKSMTTKNFSWKNLNLDLKILTGPKVHFNFLLKRLKTVKDLRISDDEMHIHSNGTPLRLKRTVTAPTNLFSLQVPYDVVNKWETIFGDAMDSAQQRVFSTLTEIAFTSHDDVVIGSQFTAGFEKLLSFPAQLQSLKFDHITPSNTNESVGAIINVLKKYCNTLKTLVLEIDIWDSTEPGIYDELIPLTFPVLSDFSARLDLNVSDSGISRLQQFLSKRTCPLQALSVDCRRNLPYSFLETVRNVCTKELKILELRTQAITIAVPPEDFTMNWEFLTALTGLEKFVYRQPSNPTLFLEAIHIRPNPYQILAALPTKISKIHLRGVNPQTDWNYAFQPHETLTCLHRLNNLVELKITGRSDLGSILNADSIIQQIATNMTRLKVLEIEDCSDVTDFGFTGEITNTAGETVCTGVSLSNLKGLRDLKLRGFSDVTSAALVKCLKFQELYILDMCVLHDVRNLFFTTFIDILV